jgi:hypothetical protein
MLVRAPRTPCAYLLPPAFALGLPLHVPVHVTPLYVRSPRKLLPLLLFVNFFSTPLGSVQKDAYKLYPLL